MDISKFLVKLFGDKKSRDLKAYRPLVEMVTKAYPAVQALSHDELRARTAAIKKQIADSALDLKKEIQELKDKVKVTDIQDRAPLFAQIDKLEKELSGIFQWALKGLQRLRNNNYVFSKCERCDKELKKYKLSLNPVAEFVNSYLVLGCSGSMKRSDIYKTYSTYCYDNSIEILNCQKFWRLFKAHCADVGFAFNTCKIKGYEYVRGVQYAK